MHRIRLNSNVLLTVFLAAVLTSCSSSKGLVNSEGGETTKEAVSAMGVVAGSYMGKPMTEEEIQQKAKEIDADPEARSAIEAITSAPQIKYSPVTGKRYSADMEYEPETGAKLLPLEP